MIAETGRGRLLIAPHALEQIVERSLDECYGVVGLRAGSRLRRAFALRHRNGIELTANGEGVELALHIVIAYGLNLAEVAAAARSGVSYELERQTGLKLARVEVLVDDVRRRG